VIEYEFTPEEGARERREALADHVGVRCTLLLPRGKETSGVIDKVGTTAVVVAGDAVPLKQVRTAWVHTGGDWITTRGHIAGSKFERIPVRCTAQDKADFKAYADAHDMSVSELMRQATKLFIGGRR